MNKIERIELYRVRMPLISPWTTAYGSDDAIESVLVRIVAADAEGWGESSPLAAPTYSPEYAKGLFNVVRDHLAPRLLGQVITSGQQLQDRLSCFKGNQFAKGALDVAWWDLFAKQLDQPLWRLLGGKNEVVEVGADFGVTDSIDALLEGIHEAVESGFLRVKLKCQPGWDLSMVVAVREAFPGLVCHIDCNSGYTLADLPMFRELDRYGLAMIEQPLAHDDLVDHAELQRQITTPICLDESINSAEKARKAIRLGACRWINIKPGRVGGLTEALKIHDLCHQADLPCWVGSMLESSLGAWCLVALGTLPNMRYPNDIFPSTRFYRQDLSRPEVCLSGPSQITAPSTPGIGAQPDPEQLSRLSVDHAILEF